MLDVIIPIYNEEFILTEYADYYKQLSDNSNLIFVDGGSSDRTVQLACEYGDVVSTQRGRWRQKNFGASQSTSENLLFLHVDTRLDLNAFDRLKKTLNNKTISGGCFQLCVDDSRFVFRIFESMVNGRAKYLKALDGDLGLFVRRDVFNEIGGFDETPVMEDIAIGRKLSKAGKITMLKNPIKVSPRRWQQEGFAKTLSLYTRNYLKYWLSPSLKG